MPKLGKASLFLFQLFVLLLPSQLCVFFWPDFAFVAGLRIDYLAPAVYLTDLVILAILIVNVREVPSLLRSKPIWLFILVVIFNGVLAQIPLLAFYKWLKMGEYIAFGWLLYKQRRQLTKYAAKPLLISLSVTLIIVLAQMLKQGSIGGLAYFLGERSFTSNTPGIALATIFGQSLLRPYATFAHPNLLGGFAVISFFYFWLNKESTQDTIAVFISLLLILVSYSQAAWLALIFGLVLSKLQVSKNVLFALAMSVITLSLLLPVIGWASYNQNWQLPVELNSRARLSIVAGKLFADNPFNGVGLGNFIPATPHVVKLLPDLFSSLHFAYLQPVHNIFLLAASEMGLLGILTTIIALYMFINPKMKASLAIILTIGLLDHYFLTLHQGILLLFFALSFLEQKN